MSNKEEIIFSEKNLKENRLNKENVTDQTSESETELKKRDILRMSNAESKKLTKECIQTALIYLMNEKPFDKITITSIIKRAGVSRSGFYRNYSSKEEILEDMESEIRQQISEVSSNNLYKENHYLWYVDCFKKIQENASEVRLLIQAKLPLDFILQSSFRFRKNSDNKPTFEKYQDIAFKSAIREIMVSWFIDGMKETPEEMGKICMAILEEPAR